MSGAAEPNESLRSAQLMGAAQLRGVLALALVVCEYLALATLFDGTELAQRGGFGAYLRSAGESVTAASLILTAGVVLNRRALTDGFRECARGLSSVSRAWLSLHALAFGVSLACLFGIFAVDASGATLVLTGAWLVSGGLSMVALARALFGRGAWVLARALGRVALAGLALGYVAWVIALESRPLWPWFARQTLLLSAAILSLVTRDVHLDPDQLLLGAGSFDAHIAAECSGIEGIGLVSVFVLGYFYQFRRTLRFPRSLVLLPLAALAAWLANAVRLAGLVYVGAHFSPEVAYGGFHSKAGWMLFCGIALSVVFLTQRTRTFSRDTIPPASEFENPTAAYCLPLLAVIAIGLVTALFAAKVDFAYPPRVIAAASLLWFHRGYYAGIAQKPGWEAVLIGVVVFALWLWLSPPVDPRGAAELRDGVARLWPDARFAWIAFRVIGGVFMTPVIEELAFRGFLQRRLAGEDFTAVSYKQVTVLSVLGSALAFGALHQAWVAGTLAGIAYSFAAYRHGRLADAMIAHATTNGLIAVWVLGFGRWELWL